MSKYEVHDGLPANSWQLPASASDYSIIRNLATKPSRLHSLMSTIAQPELIPPTPRQQWANVCLFALPVLTLSTSFGLALMQLLMLISVIYFARDGLAAWYRDNARQFAWISLAFLGYFAISCVRASFSHKPLSQLDGPLRMVFALSCIGFVAWLKPQIRYFWLGLCLGCIAACAIALVQRFYVGMERVDGYTHHPITFGDLALAMGLISLCAMTSWRGSKWQFLPPIALICGLISSVLSASRGGWLALILLTPLLLFIGQARRGKLLAIASLTAMLLLAYQIPAVTHRVQEAVSDVRLYAAKADATTSVGIRLELWKASWIMFQEHPWLGVGRTQFHASLQDLAARGQLQQSPALTYSSSHNDALHFLATGGLLDFSFLLLLYGAPLAFFVRMLKHGTAASRAPAWAGVILVLCFIGFGLTDVMFWLMMPKVFYVMMVGVLSGFCLSMANNSKE